MTKPGLTKHLIERATARLGSVKREAQQTAELELQRRQAARTILNPNEVSGEYDAGRLLVTSLRGDLRPITHDDLRAFQQNVRNLKRKFKGGIKAQDVIDLSLHSDRDRANKQIRMALPSHIREGKVKFITNAGPDSDVTRHFVDVEFLDFEAVVGASPNERKKIGKLVANGKLKFDCNCGRHRYWFRYMATIGDYNCGRSEPGFPKIRNPKLHGVACKHVLRVMQVILKDPGVQGKLADSVLRSREQIDRRKLREERVKVDELRKMANDQQLKRRASTNLKTSEDKQKVAAMRKARADMKRAAVEKAKPTDNLRQVELHAKSLLQLGAITQAQFDAIVKGQQ